MVKNGVFRFTIDFMYRIKEETDKLYYQGVWDPNSKANPLVDRVQPFIGCNSVCMSMLGSLTYMKSALLDDYFQTAEGKLRLGLVLSYTKLDVDNPTLREWSIVVIRNLCSWSADIRKDLGSLEMIGVSDEGHKALDSLGMKDMYLKEIEKLKRKNLDTGVVELDQSNMHVNVHTVDF